MVGRRVWAQPAAILLQTGVWGSHMDSTGLVDGAEWNTFIGIGGGNWSWILVCGCRRSSGGQLHLDWVVVTDCQGLEESKSWEMFREPLTPLCAASMTALPEPSACWRGHTVPNPKTFDTQGSSLGTSHGEVPRHGLGWALAGGHLPSKSPWLIWGLCASDVGLKVGLGYPIL